MSDIVISMEALHDAYLKGITNEEDLDKSIFDTKEKRKTAIELLQIIREEDIVGELEEIGKNAVKELKRSKLRRCIK